MWRRPPLPFLYTAKSAPLNWAIVVADPLFSPSLVLSLPSIFLRTKNCGCWCCCRCRPRCFVFAGNLLHSNWWARRECWGREKERTSFSFCLLRAAAAAAFRFLKWRWYFIITCLQAMDGMLVVVLLQSVCVCDRCECPNVNVNVNVIIRSVFLSFFLFSASSSSILALSCKSSRKANSYLKTAWLEKNCCSLSLFFSPFLSLFFSFSF